MAIEIKILYDLFNKWCKGMDSITLHDIV